MRRLLTFARLSREERVNKEKKVRVRVRQA